MKTIVIDAGTTNLKLAYIEHNTILEVETKGYNQFNVDKASLFEQIIDYINHYISRREYNNIAVYSFAEGGLFISRQGEVLTDIYFWDQGVDNQVYIDNVESFRACLEKNGLQIKSKYSIFKILSLRFKLNEQFIWLNMADAICYKLSNKVFTSSSLAVRTGAYDIHANKYEISILKQFGLSENNFAPVLEYVDVDDIRYYNAGHDHLNVLENIGNKSILSTGTTQVLMREIENKEVDDCYQHGAHIIYYNNKLYCMYGIEFSGDRIVQFKEKYMKDYSYDQLNQITINSQVAEQDIEVHIDVENKVVALNEYIVWDIRKLEQAYCKLLDDLAKEVKLSLGNRKNDGLIMTGGISRNELYIKYLKLNTKLEIEIKEAQQMAICGAVEKLRRTYE